MNLIPNILILAAIGAAVSFILLYLKKNYFVSKEFYAAPNTTRGFALVADFIAFNCFNFVYILAKVFLVTEYKPEFQAFAEHVFHNGGAGLGTWYMKTQAMLLMFYVPYSLICELSPLKSTIMGRFFGLKIQIEEGNNMVAAILIRNMIKPISIIFAPFFMLLSYFNPQRKWIHDQFSNTYVLREL